MIKSGKLAVFLAGACLLAACGPAPELITGPNTTAQQPVRITSTTDATYMQPAGRPVQRVVDNGHSIDETTVNRVTVLEKRVDLLQTQVDGIAADQPRTRPAPLVPAAESEDGDMRPGVAAPAPAPVEPSPLSNQHSSDIRSYNGAADGAPTSLTSADRADAVPAVRHAPAHKAAEVAGAATVRDLRIGEHPGSTRIVIDCGTKRTFKADLDNDEHLLTVDVTGNGWAGGHAVHATPKSPLVSGWQAAPDGQGGTRFVVQLRKDAKLASSTTLGASDSGKDGAAARIVLDLAGA